MIKLLIKWLALRPRIYLNLILISFTVLSILSLSYFGLTSAKDELESHSVFTSKMIADSKISDSIYQLHLASLNFTYNGNLSSADKVDFFYENIRRKLFSSDSSFTNTEVTIRSLDNYFRGFNQLRTLREKRRRSTNVILPQLEALIEQSLERLIDELKNDNTNTALTTANVMVDFMQAKGFASNYFRRLEGESLQQTRFKLNRALDQLTAIRNEVKQPALRFQVDDISQQIQNYANSFNVSVEETRGFLYLVNVILAAEANEILYQAEIREGQLKDNIMQQRQLVDEKLSGLVSLVLFVSLIALLLQVLVSYWITMTVTTPIIKITEVFNELTQGSGNSTIPQYPQNDEIGDLSKAARMFKQKNVENRKVLNDYRELSEQLERRILERTQELNSMNKELELAKEKAEEMVQVRSDFIANVSHEIRTPINAVLGMTYLMRHTELNEQQAEYIESINLSSKKLLAIINDILDFSKIEAGKLTIETTKLDLFQVVADSISMLNTQAVSKGIEIYSHFDSHVSRYYYGDPLRLGQVITNLLNNAVKFTEKGHVAITVEAINIQRLKISIKDTGIGMDENAQKQLFSAFNQADASTTRRFGGTGLGLVISKQIIEAMKGQISVESQKDKGTTFSFEVDMKRVNSNNNNEQFKGLSALLIDSDPISRNSFNHALQHLGFEVRSFERFIRDQESTFDVILYALEDQYHSALDADLVSQLSAAFPNVPLCLIYPMGKTPEMSGNSLQNNFIQKPLNPNKVKKTLSKMLDLDKEALTDSHLHDMRKELAMRAGSRVIVADDNLFNRQVVSGLLSKSNIHVDEAINGQDLIDQVTLASQQYTPYELIFVDYHMPTLNGLEACSKLHKLYPEIPIVVLSGDTDSKTKQKFFSAGAQSLLGKPIEINEFYEIVLSYLAPKQAQSIHHETLHDSSIPNMIMIDTSAGLRHSGGDLKLYQTLLSSFKQKYQYGDEEFKALFESQNFDELALAAHSLKGIAGSIGAHALARSAKNLEQTPSRENVEDLINELLKVMGELASLGIEKKANKTLVAFDAQQFEKSLHELLAAVKTRRPKQISPCLDYIKSVDLPNDRQKEVQELVLLIERFEYNNAVKMMETMLND